MVGLLSVVAGLGACGDSLQPSDGAGVSEPAPEEEPGAPSAPAPTPPNEVVAKALALALQDPDLRLAVFREMSSSPVKEGKLHVPTYLRAGGTRLLAGMARAAELSEAELLALLDSTRALELYMPVEEHRAAWSGGDDVIVATQMDEAVAPVGVDLNGDAVPLSLDGPPEIPVIALVPVESFDAEGRPYGRDIAPKQGTEANLLGWYGLWVNEVHTGHDYESWVKGKPEFELHLQNANTRADISCPEEDFSAEPYRWDMNGLHYYNDFLLATEGAIPLNTPVEIAMYEDDDTRCVIKDDKDYIKLTIDVINAAGGVVGFALGKKTSVNNQFILDLFNGWVALKSIILGNDEFVGVATGLSDVGSTAKTFTLYNQAKVPTGYLTLQWKTDVAH